jgi:hypothetical protein
LWGEPDRRTSKELRWNGADAYSAKTFNCRKRIWYDAGQQRGGSTLELVAYAKGEPAEKLRGTAFFNAWQYAYDQKWVPDPPPPKLNGGGKPIIATYPYTDEDGALLFEVVRFDTADPKDRFKQRRPDRGGGWIWKRDECYGPKDKSAEGTLKRLITEDTLMIEAKGRDPIEEPNRLHVMLASNNEWVVPAGAYERRFVVQRVADTHRQDAAWFGPIYKQMRAGGYEAMLFDLLHRDLGDWHPRQIVPTAALAEQQEESLSPLDAWWLQLLQTAVLAGANSSAPDRAISNKYEDEISESDGFGGTRTHTVKRDGLYDQARAVSPKLKGYTDAALGRYLRQQGCRNAWVRRHRGWQFAPLAECRKRWLERFPMTVWHDAETKEWTTGGED